MVKPGSSFRLQVLRRRNEAPVARAAMPARLTFPPLSSSRAACEAYVYFKHDEGVGSGPTAVDAFRRVAGA
jgi:hypothetical protein